MRKTLEERALEFATKAHGQITRKLSNDLYIVHPIEVANLLKEAGGSPELVAAGFLHDVVEDTDYTINDIRNEFGSTVSFYVASNTEQKGKTWLERKTHTIHSLVFKTLDERLLLIADKYANLSDIKKALSTKTEEEVWAFFKRAKNDQRWYYTSIALSMNIGLTEEEPELFKMYRELVNEVFQLNIKEI